MLINRYRLFVVHKKTQIEIKSGQKLEEALMEIQSLVNYYKGEKVSLYAKLEGKDVREEITTMEKVDTFLHMYYTTDLELKEMELEDEK